jgi:hypothetical protein
MKRMEKPLIPTMRMNKRRSPGNKPHRRRELEHERRKHERK